MAGVLLAVVGVMLFWNGVNSRLAGGRKADPTRPITRLTDSGNVTVPSSAGSVAVMLGAVESTAVTPGAPESEVSPLPPGGETKGASGEAPLSSLEPSPSSFDDPDERKRALLEMLAKGGWSREELDQLQALLADPRARFRGEILVRNSTFTESAEQYAHNLTTDAVLRCVQFYRDQDAPLTAASSREGVAPEMLVAILKVETNLGGWLGKESVFNVFWSLALGDNPDIQKELLTRDSFERMEMQRRMVKRAFWARGQLRDLLYVARHGGEDPVGIMGSFAGAFGLPQFIPSSYRSYGRDGDGDGVVDLDGIADAAASIAFYLKENGWTNSGDRARKKRAILTYNHSTFYADCVLALTDSIAERLRDVPLVP